MMHQFIEPALYRIGYQVEAMGDVNADGIPDFAYSLGGNPPYVNVISGQDYSVIHTLGPVAGSYSPLFGTRDMSAQSDINGDGVRDLVLGDDNFSDTLGGEGAVYCFDSATGAMMWRQEGVFITQGFGVNVGNPGDLNGDGIGDVLGASSSAFGHVLVMSGLDGSPIGTWWDGPYFGASLGTSGIDGIDDYDGDGLVDVLIGAGASGGYGNGHVLTCRGVDGTVLLDVRHEGDPWENDFPVTLANVGDVDGDGRSDFAAQSWLEYGLHDKQGVVYVHSGRDGTPLKVLLGASGYSSFFGASIAGGEDVNGDGLSDIACGDPGEQLHPNGFSAPGAAYVFSFDPYLRASDNEISAAVGGPVVLQLAFPASEAGKAYQLFVSADMAGVTNLNGVEVPLANLDRAQALMRDLPPGAIGFRGKLDGNAQARAVLRFAPNRLAGQIGKSVRIAAVSFDPGQVPRLSSAPARVTVVP